MFNITNYSNTDTNSEILDSTARENDSLGILDYGKANAFPALLLETLRESHTSNRCLDAIFRFVVGDGFEDESLNNVLINPEGDTLKDLLDSHAMDVSYFEGLYTNVSYDLNAKGKHYYHLPFENSRIGELQNGRINKYKSNINWGLTGSTQDNEDSIEYHSFTVNEDRIRQQIQEVGIQDYNGQVLYNHIKRPQARFYPIPQYYSAHHWISVDSKISSFHSANIDNNFMLSVLLKIVGDPDEEYIELKKDNTGNLVRKKTGKKVGDVFNELMKTEFSGSKNGGKVMVLWSKIAENFPQLESFPSNTNHDLFLALQQLTTDNLVIAFGTPRVLANIGVSGSLGDSNEIKNAAALMKGNIRSYQQMIEGHYTRLFSNTSIPQLQNKTFKIKPFKYDTAEANEIIEVDKNITTS